MKSKLTMFIATCSFALSGCLSGGVNYVKPNQAATPPVSSVIVSKPKDAVWKELIPAIGKTFWVINNLDKESGFVNISYSGDPELYVDCGEIFSRVNGGSSGDRVYTFKASTALYNYQAAAGQMLVLIERKMNLEGRINIIVQEISPGQTQLTINPKFILNRSIHHKNMYGIGKTESDSISFNSGQTGRFPGGTECISNGQLEATILGLLNDVKAK